MVLQRENLQFGKCFQRVGSIGEEPRSNVLKLFGLTKRKLWFFCVRPLFVRYIINSYFLSSFLLCITIVCFVYQSSIKIVRDILKLEKIKNKKDIHHLRDFGIPSNTLYLMKFTKSVGNAKAFQSRQHLEGLPLTYQPWHRQNDILGPGPNFSSLHQMRWASRCIPFQDVRIELKTERCFPVVTENKTLTSILFVVGSCVVNFRNFRLFKNTVASIRRFHAGEDVLVFDNCPRDDSSKILLSEWLGGVSGLYRNFTYLRSTSGNSLFEFGAFANGVSFMFRKKKHEYIAFLQHSTKLTRPIATPPDFCPVYLQRPWSLWGDPHVQHTEFISGKMYNMMYMRGIPKDFILGNTDSWLSVGDGTVVLHRTLASYLRKRRLLDSAMVDQCRYKGCFESVSGLFGMYAGFNSGCRDLHVHAITKKLHGGN